MKNLTKQLDTLLTSNISLNTDNSGSYSLFSSEILLLIVNEIIFIANLGDTRAIASTISQDKLYGKNSLVPQQLTDEHRPEYTEEYKRITDCGGRVNKLIGINGNHQGPYRVWEAFNNSPGLTISRSLGNLNCKEIGIIAEPNTYSYAIDKEKFFFLVIASDGIWDVMDNQEVINFIETYRGSCIKGLDICTHHNNISFNNTCISHLLCEEARTRWLLKIEDEEETRIDDISCVIIELKLSDSNSELIEDSHVRRINLEEAKERETRKTPTIADTIISKERRRSSLIGVSVLNSKTEM